MPTSATRCHAAAIAAVVVLVACASRGGATGRMLASGTPTALAVGETIALPDRSPLTYVGVRRDSRCPPVHLCIQAGSATVAFRHGRNPGREVVLETPASPAARFGAWRLTLVDLDFGSSPKATIRVDAAP